ncbi:GIY-YIG nuclease family protein [Legionella sp. CNM-4043-24]|uniref:GIY-YIG nuclease family protein n=1 Tax=Legionella sp. CNM-4043-24 TaxID=3421646 RepID=UPI00403B1D06
MYFLIRFLCYQESAVTTQSNTARNSIDIHTESYVYLLANKHHNVLYTGVTNDLIRRVYEHKNKLVAGFTQKYNVDRLVYFEVCSGIVVAIEREKQIKGWSRKKKHDLINSLNPEWNDLYRSICYRSCHCREIPRCARDDVVSLQKNGISLDANLPRLVHGKSSKNPGLT